MHEISATFKQATLHIITLEVAMMDSTITTILYCVFLVWDRFNVTLLIVPLK